MQEIKKIGIISVAKIALLFGLFFGLIQGVLIGQVSMQYAQEGFELTFLEAIQYISQNPSIGIAPLLIWLGWWSILIAPIVLGIVYFVSGIIIAWLFNISTKILGGIKVELQEPKKKK